mgnify:CR=1 FL=1
MFIFWKTISKTKISSILERIYRDVFLYEKTELQLIVALQHLISGKSVQQVAQSLGYDSTTAFITMFRKGLGQTPARYMASLTTTSQ